MMCVRGLTCPRKPNIYYLASRGKKKVLFSSLVLWSLHLDYLHQTGRHGMREYSWEIHQKFPADCVYYIAC